MTDGIVGKVTWEDETPTAGAASPAADPNTGIVGKVTWDAPASKPSAPSQPEGRSFLRAAGDLGIGLGEGVVSAGLAIPQLANTLTGGAVDKYLFKPATGALDRALGGPGEGNTLAAASQQTRDAMDTLKSPVLRQHEQELADTKGFWPTARKFITDPMLVTQQGAEQLPQLIAPAGAARKVAEVVAGKAAERVGKAVLQRQLARGATESAAKQAAGTAVRRLSRSGGAIGKAAGTASALGVRSAGSAVGGAQASEQAQQEVLGLDQKVLDANPAYQELVARGLSPDDARQELAQQAGQKAGAIAAAGDFLVGGLTSRLESNIFRGETGIHGLGELLAPKGLANVGKAAGREFVEEALQEGPSEQFASNVGVQVANPDQDLLDQVPEQAALGGTLGLVAGGGGTAVSGALTRPAGPLQRAAEAASGTGAAAEVAAAAAPTPGSQGAGAQAAPVDEPVPVQTSRSTAQPQPRAAPEPAAAVQPTPAPWIDTTTGEVHPPTPQQLVAQMATHLEQQYQTAGHMRADNKALAEAWGVTPSAIKAVRGKAYSLASRRIRQAEAQEAANAAAPESTNGNERVPGPAAGEAAATGAEAAGAADAKPAAVGNGGLGDISQQPGAAVRTAVAGAGDTTESAETLKAEATSSSAGGSEAGRPETSASRLETSASDTTPASQEPALAGEAPAAPAPAGGVQVAGTSPAGESAATQTGVARPSPQDTAASEAAPPAATEAPTETPPIGGVSVSGEAPAAEASNEAGSVEAGAVGSVRPAGEPEAAPAVVAPAAEVGQRTSKESLTARIEPLGSKGMLVHGDAKQVRTALAAAGIKKRGRPLKGALRFDAKDRPAIEKALGLAKASPVEAAAAEAAPSPANAAPEPTAAQHEAGNFKMGHVRLHGLDVTIEVPKGGKRRGTDRKGKEWERTAAAHYGYIRRTEGADGEQVDVYLGPKADDAAAPVFVIDQVKPGTQDFDEHKVMMGFANAGKARAAYDRNFPAGLKVFGGIQQMTLDEFKDWLKSGDMKQPAAKEAAATENASAARQRAIQADFEANRKARDDLKLRKGDAVSFEADGRTLTGEILSLGDKEQAVVAVGVKGSRGVADHHVGARRLTKVTPSAEAGAAAAVAPAPAIDDFGERLEGARKFLPPSLKEVLGDDQIAAQPLSKLWPADAYKSIEDPATAALAFAARAEVPAKPRVAYKVKRWVEQVKMLRGLLGQTHDAQSMAAMEALARRLGSRLEGFFAKVRLLAQLPRETWGRVDRVGEYPDAKKLKTDAELKADGFIRVHDPKLGSDYYRVDPETGQKTGKRIVAWGETAAEHDNLFKTTPFSAVTIDGTTHRFDGADRIGPDEVQKVKDLLAGASARKAVSLTAQDFEIRRYRSRAETFINRKGDAEKRPLKTFTGPEATKEARAWLDDNVPTLEAAWKAVKARDNVSKADTRRKENRAREGADYRGGKDVTPAVFEQTFGFRGVQFGNWVGQGKDAKGRQGLLNDTYDALLDLAVLLGVPSRAISLNGSLGLSLGARGHGWASAHFEPSNLVINLTKTRGSGTLAHEWFHALDNYFSRLRGGEVPFNGDQDAYRRNNYITYKPEPAWVHAADRAAVAPRTSADLRTTLRQRGLWDEGKTLQQNAAAAGWRPDPNHKHGVRPEVERAFADLVQALNDSPMAVRASRLDKSGDYWHRIIERGARSFENYVISKLALQGQNNDFLANVADWKTWEALGKNEDRYPYLRPEEEAPVVVAFDNLFSTLETRETEGGNVALFALPSDDAHTFDAARTAAARFIGQPIKNEHGLPPATVSNTTLGKMLSEKAASKSVSGAAHAKAVANLDALYRVGLRDDTHQDVKDEPTIAAIHRVVAPMLGPDGSVLAVKMTVKETTSPKNPNPLYSVEAIDVTKPALLTPESGGERGTEQGRPPLQAGFSADVTRMLEEFKRGAMRLAQEPRSATADAVKHLRQVNAWQQELTLQWGENQPRVRVVHSADLLPDAAKSDPRYRRALGFYDGNQVWLVAPNLGSRAAVLKTLTHEAVGHYGVDRIIEDELGKGAWGKVSASVEAMRARVRAMQAANRAAGRPADAGLNPVQKVVAEVERRYGADTNATTFAKETLAVMSEKGVRNTWLDRAVAAMRRWLRRIMPDLKPTGAELRQLLVRSDRYLRTTENYATRVARVQAMMFAKAPPIDSQPFRRFFDGSQVVDAAGAPMLVYHGTADEFSVFADTETGTATGHTTSPLGFFFTPSRPQAQRYAENASQGVPAEERVVDAYLAIRKPYTLTLKEAQAIESPDQARALRTRLEKEGYDGIHMPESDAWVAFHAGQIKSASGNAGTFDASNPDINFSMPGDQSARRPYQGVPDSLMGFRRSGTNKSFDEQKYAYEQPVRVTFPDGDTFTDVVKGLNSAHALERARRNWPGATVEPAAAAAGESNFSLPEGRQEALPDAAATPKYVWRNDKPLKRHADYAAAKAGDAAAAVRLVGDIAEPLVAQAKTWGPDVVYVAPHAQEASGMNAIPRTMAAYLAARAGGRDDTEIVQTNRSYHTGADAMQRLLARSTFAGAVTPGARYVLVDDVSTMGGTLADLAGYIQSQGGDVVGTAVLVNASRAGTMQPSPALVRQLERRYGDEIRDQFHIEPAALTADEAQYLVGFRSADELRNRAAKAERARAERLRAKGVQEALNPTDETPPPGGVSGSGNFSLPAANVEQMDKVLAEPDEGAWQRAKGWMAGKWEDLKPWTLGALQMRHVLELAEDHPALKGASRYAGLVQRMDADRNALLTGAPDAAEHPENKLRGGVAPLAERWRKAVYEKGLAGLLGRKKAVAQQLSDLMHDATIYGLDPSGDYTRLMMADSKGNFEPWTKEGLKERIKALNNQKRGRAGDAKDMLVAEVLRLKGLPAREKLREHRWPSLIARYNALPAEAKQIFKDVRDWYRQHADATEEALIDRINLLDVPEAYKRSMIDRIRLQFESNRVEGIYFPLDRNGEYWLSMSDTEGQQGFKMFESARELEQAERKLRKAGFTIEATGRRDQNYKAKDAPAGSFVRDIIEMMKKAGSSETLQDQVYQLFLRTLPEMSVRKRQIHRRAVPGYSEDALRAFAKNGFHGSYQLSRLRYSQRMQMAIEGMQASLDTYRGADELGNSSKAEGLDAARGDALLQEIKRRHDWIMAPTDSGLANRMTSIGFIYYLGLGPASALVNLTQSAQVTLPVLAAAHGWNKAGRVLASTTAAALRTGGNIQRTLTDDEERRAYRALEVRGDIDRTQSHTLAALAEGNALAANPTWTRVMNGISWMFHKAEIVNREATGIAAFRLARAAGKEFAESVQYASDIINGTHFDYTAANRPRFMQNGMAKVLLQFKNYSVGMTWLMYRNLYQAFKGESPEVRRVARRTLTGVLGVTGLMAGMVGLPLINAIAFVAGAAHAAFGDDDEPWDFMTEFRAWLAEHFGETGAALIADGALNPLGADVASRVSLSNLWFRDADRQLEGRDAYYNLLDAFAGPVGGITKNMYVGAQRVGEGQVWRGVETMLPTAVKNAMKSMRYAAEGANTLRGDPIIEDPSAAEDILQALGFRPTRLAEQQRVNSALLNYQDQIRDRRQRLMNAFAMALRQQDSEARQAILERIRAFNAQYPEIAVTTATLRQSLRARQRYSQQASGGVALDRRLAARLRQDVGVQPTQ